MDEKLKYFGICLIGCVAFCLIMWLFFVNNSVDDIFENKIGYDLIFFELGWTFAGACVFYFFWNEIVAGVAYLFSPEFSMFYSIAVSVIILMFLAGEQLKFAEPEIFIEKIANAFIVLLIIQPAVFFIKLQDRLTFLIRSIILTISGFIALFFYVLAGQNLPKVNTGAPGKLVNTEVMFLALMAFLVIIAAALEYEKYAKHKKV